MRRHSAVSSSLPGVMGSSRKQVRLGTPELIRRPRLRGSQQSQGRIERAGLVLGLRRGERSLRRTPPQRRLAYRLRCGHQHQ